MFEVPALNMGPSEEKPDKQSWWNRPSHFDTTIAIREELLEGSEENADEQLLGGKAESSLNRRQLKFQTQIRWLLIVDALVLGLIAMLLALRRLQHATVDSNACVKATSSYCNSSLSSQVSSYIFNNP